jgi:hypothetical protein
LKLVKLTKGLFAKVDDADYEEVSKYNWSAVANSKLKKKGVYAFYAYRNLYPRGTQGMHRFMFKVIPEGFEIDHMNGDGLDNRRANLRAVTRGDNIRNKVVERVNYEFIEPMRKEVHRRNPLRRCSSIHKFITMTMIEGRRYWRVQFQSNGLNKQFVRKDIESALCARNELLLSNELDVPD